MRSKIFLVILLCISIFGCRSKSGPAGDLKNIDLSQAMDLKKSVNLSELAKSVEIIQFYPAEDTYFVNARTFSIGKKYIMIADDGGGGRSNIILCERSGKFVRTIGRTGKGPGEFLKAWLVIMDPSEQYIIIADDQSNKLIKYSVSGDFIKEHKMEELPNRSLLDKIQFINKDEFVLAPRRPTRGIDGFASMLVYDLDLNLTGKILPRANDKNLPLFNNSYQNIGEGPDRIFYWEPYFDTLYTIRPDHSTKATHKIGWSKNGPSFKYMSSFTYGLPPEEQYPINFIYSVVETKKYFFIDGMSHQIPFRAAYDKKSEEVFTLSDRLDCDTTSYKTNTTIKNDLFAIEPVYIQGFDQLVDRYVAWIRPSMIASGNDLDCIRKREVKLPEIRDRLLEIAVSPDVDNNLVLLLLEEK